MLSSVMQSGVNGMQSSLQNMTRAAQHIAQGSINVREAGDTGQHGTANPLVTHDVTESLVELKYNVLLFKASAKVLVTSDTMIGSLLDVRA